jgi:hypothetical protein
MPRRTLATDESAPTSSIINITDAITTVGKANPRVVFPYLIVLLFIIPACSKKHERLDI